MPAARSRAIPFSWLLAPAHADPPPALLLQVLDSKRTYQSASFGLEERFDRDRREMHARVTPGPGTYRV